MRLEPACSCSWLFSTKMNTEEFNNKLAALITEAIGSKVPPEVAVHYLDSHKCRLQFDMFKAQDRVEFEKQAKKMADNAPRIVNPGNG